MKVNLFHRTRLMPMIINYGKIMKSMFVCSNVKNWSVFARNARKERERERNDFMFKRVGFCFLCLLFLFFIVLQRQQERILIFKARIPLPFSFFFLTYSSPFNLFSSSKNGTFFFITLLYWDIYSSNSKGFLLFILITALTVWLSS